MVHTPLTSIFVGLRAGLHILFVALVALVIGRAIVVATPASVIVIALAVVLLASYALGGYVANSTRSSRDVQGGRHLGRVVWLAVLSIEWLALVWLIPEAAYLVFPLFFLYLHLLRRPWGTLAVVVAVTAAIIALGLHSGWSVGGVVGPLVGAAVAILIGLGYQSLAREAAERETLVEELVATRGQLAATERESGILAERARLAREIHDTVAQGLSSIQMLLHAAERADPEAAGIEHIRLARDTAATNLADARRFIRELSPAALADRGLAAALVRLAETQWRSTDLEVEVRLSDSLDLPIEIQAALLRITQGAMANVLQHARASTATIEIARDGHSVQLTVSDNGIGFDADGADADRAIGATDSFGLTAIRERVDQLDGTLTMDAAPGGGSRLTVVLTIDGPG